MGVSTRCLCGDEQVGAVRDKLTKVERDIYNYVINAGEGLGLEASCSVGSVKPPSAGLN